MMKLIIIFAAQFARMGRLKKVKSSFKS